MTSSVSSNGTIGEGFAKDAEDKRVMEDTSGLREKAVQVMGTVRAKSEIQEVPCYL